MADGGKRLAPAVQGFLQSLQPRRVRGWAWLPAERDEHLAIEIFVDGIPVARTTASARFADLRRNRIGEGDHGFLLDLAADLPVDQPERIEVVASSGTGLHRVLPLSEGARSRGGPAEPPPAPARVAPPQSTGPHFTLSDRAHRPVFVLGSARSGTTAMVQALRATGRYAGFGEGHFLTLFAQLEATVATHYARSVRDAAPNMNTFIAHVPSETVVQALHHGFIEIARAAFPAGCWLDKTPGPDMIRAAPALQRMWPEARFIFMKRHPVDNIESRRRKFPTIAFIDHCKLWSDSMLSWLAVRNQLAEAGVEIDQMRMAAEPEGVTAAVARLLQLTGPEAGRMIATLKSGRPQKTGDGAPLTLATADWTPIQCNNFRTICAEAIRAFDYEIEPAPVEKPRKSRRKPAAC